MSSTRTLHKLLAGVASVVAVLAAPAVASAARPFTLEKATVGAGLRFGSDDVNLGLGARGGYTIREQVYIGGLFDYWFGESEEYGFGPTRAEASFSAWDLLAVGGYDFGVSPVVVIRPFGGLGIVSYHGEVCTRVLGNEDCFDESDTEAAGTFGGEVLLDLGSFNLGGEFRVIFSDNTHAIIGANFGGAF
jgi:hypothetical protein